MKISTAWVKQFTDIKLDKDELVERIGSQLGAIEDVEDWSSYYDENIVVGEIVRVREHPDADKLGVYQVLIDQNKEVTVVAGDKTLTNGDKVAYIPPGVSVPVTVRDGNPQRIEKVSLRGIESEGMMASPKELIFSDDHSHVLVLDTDKPVGTSIRECYDLDDIIIDVENKMFTHRPDLFGILGLARELAGIQGIQFTSPEWYKESVEFDEVEETLPLTVENQAKDLCPRFSALTFKNVEIKPSPQIMQSYLMRVGMRPVNNVVDVTNYAMYLTAQPTHAFDYDKVAKRSKDHAHIVVRRPEKGEKLTLLDGREIQPHADAAMVATNKELISVGGSIGGSETEVDKDTKNIIVEAASWDLYSIRRTSYMHGIFTDAVTRFNKGQSSRQTLTSLHLISDMLNEHAAAEQASNLVDEYTSPSENVSLEVAAGFVNLRLGSEFSAEQMSEILNKTEIKSDANHDKVKIDVPFWRQDLHIAEDIVEEIGRLHGYDNLPVEVPMRRSVPNSRSKDLTHKQQVREIISAAGAHEVLSYNFVSSRLFENASYGKELFESAYRIRNSLSPELEFMRISLLPSLIEKIQPNIRTGHSGFALFEVNKTHNKKQIDADGLPLEQDSVALVVASDQEQNGSAYYQAKSYLDYLCSRLGLDVRFVHESDSDISTPYGAAIKSVFANNRVAAIEVGEHRIGFVGEFSAQTKRRFKLPAYSAGFEVRLDKLHAKHIDYQQISKYPELVQDVTLQTPKQVEYADLRDLMHKSLQSDDVMVTVAPLDIYQAEQTTDTRNITFRLHFRPNNRTLNTGEINTAIAQMVAKTSDLGIKQV